MKRPKFKRNGNYGDLSNHSKDQDKYIDELEKQLRNSALKIVTLSILSDAKGD